MISGVYGLPYFEEESLYTTSEEDKLGRDAFMKLFLSQLNHQDPLNPMDTSQFSSQLAEFSTLEQLFNMNENLEAIMGTQSNDSKYHALDLMGKDVQAQSDTLVMTDDSLAKGAYYLDTAAEGCVIRIYDDSGRAIRDIVMEDPEYRWAGTHTFEWDGCDDDGNMMEPGLYSYNVSAVSREGDLLDVEKYTQGTVTRVSLFEEEPVIYIGNTPLSMEQIVNINLTGENTEEQGT